MTVIGPLILIVDDSPTDLHVMQQALEKGGYRTEIALDGEDAIRKTKALKPALVLMDIVMPGMNGFQATRELVNDPETKAIPVVMITSKAEESDRIWGLRQGAVDYLVKPLSPQELVARVGAALRR